MCLRDAYSSMYVSAASFCLGRPLSYPGTLLPKCGCVTACSHPHWHRCAVTTPRLRSTRGTSTPNFARGIPAPSPKSTAPTPSTSLSSCVIAFRKFIARQSPLPLQFTWKVSLTAHRTHCPRLEQACLCTPEVRTDSKNGSSRSRIGCAATRPCQMMSRRT